MIGFYNYSVILTYLGLASAIVGMVQALDKNPKTAIICLIICGICDMFDGAVARTCKKRSEDAKAFGVQIDSLCDLVCFGVFPAVIAYGLGLHQWYAVVCMVIYVLCAVIRLGYFNVQEINRKANGEEKRTYYQGLPVTSSAFILPLFLLADILINKFFPAVSAIQFYYIALLIIGLLFIADIKIKKLYNKTLIAAGVLVVAVLVLIIVFGDKIQCVA